MKSLILPLLLLIVSIASAQKIVKKEQVSDHSIYVKGNSFEGVIFSKDYIPPKYSYDDSIKRFDLTDVDIIQAEKLLKQDIKRYGVGAVKDTFICNNIKKYVRQYAGFTTSNNQKIIFINFVWKKEVKREEKDHKIFPQIPYYDWKREWQFYFDGGAHY